MQAAQTIEDLVPNATLGNYTILEHLADGGMGHVYRAFETALQREVAIKVLKMDLAANSHHVAFFEEEAQNIAALRHPNIVPVYYMGRQGKLFYFVMAFIEGGATLDDWIEAETPINIDQGIHVMDQATDALDSAFQRNIIHLDIKPSNFLVDTHGSILLTDFGLARSLTRHDDEDASRECYGTPAYMSPEQVLRQPTDQRSDIYGLGATLFHLLTMNFLHDGDTVEEIIAGHINKPFPRKIAVEKGLPPGWIHILEKMTQKDPALRYQNYKELREALSHIDRLRPSEIDIQAEQPDGEKPIAVPNRSAAPKGMLYGLLGAASAGWAHGGIDLGVKKARSEVLEMIDKPRSVLTIEGYTRALMELQETAQHDLDDLAETMGLMPEVEDFMRALANSGFVTTTASLQNPQDVINALTPALSQQLILTGLILRKDSPYTPSFNWEPLIQHSMSVGIIAHGILAYFEKLEPTSSLARITTRLIHQSGKDKKLAYCAGMLHDCGKFALGEIVPYLFYASMRRAMDLNTSLHDLELSCLSITHEEVGVRWVGKFTIDSHIRESIEHHGDLNYHGSRLWAAIAMANQIAKRLGLGFSGSPIVEKPFLGNTYAWQILSKEVTSTNITPERFEVEFVSRIADIPVMKLPKRVF